MREVCFGCFWATNAPDPVDIKYNPNPVPVARADPLIRRFLLPTPPKSRAGATPHKLLHELYRQDKASCTYCLRQPVRAPSAPQE